VVVFKEGMMDLSEWRKVTEVAAQLNISRRSIIYYGQKRRFSMYRHTDRTWYVKEDEIDLINSVVPKPVLITAETRG
jgi:hypothetical protein